MNFGFKTISFQGNFNKIYSENAEQVCTLFNCLHVHVRCAYDALVRNVIDRNVTPVFFHE